MMGAEQVRPANKWLERTMLGVTWLAEGKRRAARPPLSHTVGCA
jgi:hypothetical protein